MPSSVMTLVAPPLSVTACEKSFVSRRNSCGAKAKNLAATMGGRYQTAFCGSHGNGNLQEWRFNMVSSVLQSVPPPHLN